MQQVSKAMQIAQRCDMHWPPDPFVTRRELVANPSRAPRRSGIYFAWCNGKCVYVGKSTKLSARLQWHTEIGLDDGVSWLEMGQGDIHHAELFYIWLLRPARNGETKAATKYLSRVNREIYLFGFDFDDLVPSLHRLVLRGRGGNVLEEIGRIKNAVVLGEIVVCGIAEAHTIGLEVWQDGREWSHVDVLVTKTQKPTKKALSC